MQIETDFYTYIVYLHFSIRNKLCSYWKNAWFNVFALCIVLAYFATRESQKFREWRPLKEGQQQIWKF